MTTTRSSDMVHDPRLVRWRLTFFWAVVLLIVFTIAAGVIIRFSFRYRDYLTHKPHAPTPSEDVWAMHKTPQAMQFDGEEDSGESDDAAPN